MSEISGLDDIRTMMVARTDRARGFRQVVIPPVVRGGRDPGSVPDDR